MAKVVDYYEGRGVGDADGSHFYWYAKADDTSKATRVYVGDTIKLPSWYASEMNNGMYRITYPGNGWMFWWNVGSIKPVYKTVTDACTPPSKVTLDTAQRMLTIEGGAGGDLNTFQGYGVSWRDRDANGLEWTEWSSDTVIAGNSMTVSADAKKIRQFRVRTLGSAGEKYYSEYTACGDSLTGNTASGAPVILIPANGTVTYEDVPRYKIFCPADPDGNELTLKARGSQWPEGEWIDILTIPAGSGDTTVYVRQPELPSYPQITIFKLVDSQGAESPETRITVKSLNVDELWERDIVPGVVISNKEISHAAEIRQMLEQINVNRAYCGFDPVTLPGTVGKFADWKKQMETLLAAGNEYCVAFGDSELKIDVPDYPDATVVRYIRSLIM